MNTPHLFFRVRRYGGVLVLCLMLLLALFLMPNAYAEDIYVGRQDGSVIWSLDRDTGELRIYADNVTAAPAWQGLAPNVRSVYIAPGVTRIPNNAFSGCASLTDIFLPDTVTSIGSYAFADCVSLSSLSLPAKLSYIGECAFRGCTRLSQLTFRGRSDAWEALMLQASSLLGNDALCQLTPIYTLPTCRLTIHYVDEGTGQRIAPSEERTVTQSASLTVTAPHIEYYTPVQSTVTLASIPRDQTLTVRYRRTHCKITVHYLDEDGAPVLSPQQLSVAYGTAVTLQAPAVAGYEPIREKQITLSAVLEEDCAYTFVYRRVQLYVTVHCVDAQGVALCPPITVDDVPFGGAYYIALPSFEGYTAERTSLEGENVTQSAELTVRYERTRMRVTLHYLDTDGNKLSEPDTLWVDHGASVSQAPKSITGYTPDTRHIELGPIRQDTVHTLTYRPAFYTLSVRHVSEQGLLLDQTYQTVAYGESYTVQAMSLRGYEVVPESLSAATGTMPPEPLTVTLLYRTADGGAPSDQAPLSGQVLTTLLTVALCAVTAAVFVLCALALRRRMRAGGDKPNT